MAVSSSILLGRGHTEALCESCWSLSLSALVVPSSSHIMPCVLVFLHIKLVMILASFLAAAQQISFKGDPELKQKVQGQFFSNWLLGLCKRAPIHIWYCQFYICIRYQDKLNHDIDDMTEMSYPFQAWREWGQWSHNQRWVVIPEGVRAPKGKRKVCGGQVWHELRWNGGKDRDVRKRRYNMRLNETNEMMILYKKECAEPGDLWCMWWLIVIRSDCDKQPEGGVECEGPYTGIPVQIPLARRCPCWTISYVHFQGPTFGSTYAMMH
jgi:hypothetical protein